MNETDWIVSGGLYCPKCGSNMVRMINGQCLQCYKATVMEREKKAEDRSMRRFYYRRLREGTISLREMRENRL